MERKSSSLLLKSKKMFNCTKPLGPFSILNDCNSKLSLFTIMLNIKIHVLIQLLHVIVKFEAFVIGYIVNLICLLKYS